MTIALDDAKFHELIAATVGNDVAPSEIHAAIDVAQLAASIDLDDDPQEQVLLGALIDQLCALAGLDRAAITPLSPVPTDDEARAAWLASVVPFLESQGARELAYVLAYLVIVVDLELAPIETNLLDDLQRALRVPRERGSELLEMASFLVTPSELPEPDPAHPLHT